MSGIASASSSALQRFDDEGADARMAAAEPEQLEDDHQPRDMARKRVAEAGAVREDEVGLKLGETVVRECACWRAGRSRC